MQTYNETWIVRRRIWHVH